MHQYLILCVLLKWQLIINGVDGKVECFLVKGRLACPHYKAKTAHVQIDLIDEDPLPLEKDDTMGRTWTTENGSFVISGCGSDFGPLNTPDPYIRIYHSCPHKDGKKTNGYLQLDIVPIYLPNIINIGTIYIDR